MRHTPLLWDKKNFFVIKNFFDKKNSKERVSGRKGVVMNDVWHKTENHYR